MRTNHVSKARKGQGTCESCRQEIAKGQAYKWIKSRYGPKRSRHADCPSWRPSEMTGSKMATAYAAQEGGHDDLDAIDASLVNDAATAEAFVDDVKAALAAVAEGGNECAGDYQEGIDNLPDSLQDGPTAEESREKIDALEQWASDLEDWTPDAEWSDAVDDIEDDDERQDAISEWTSEVIDNARAAIDGLEY